MLKRFLILCVLGAAFPGCTSFQMGEYIKTWSDLPAGITLECSPKENSSLESGQDVLSMLPRLSTDIWIPPRPLQNDKAIEVMVETLDAGVGVVEKTGLESGVSEGKLQRTFTNGKGTSPKTLSRADMDNFEEKLRQSLPQRIFSQADDSNYLSLESGQEMKDNRKHVFKKYFMEYATKGYVTRHGGRLDQPKVTTRYGADMFGAVTQILVEAGADSINGVPILYIEKQSEDTKKPEDNTLKKIGELEKRVNELEKKGESSENKVGGIGETPKVIAGKVAQRLYLPLEKSIKPTAVALGVVDSVKLLDDKDSQHCGITRAEYKLMRAAAAGTAELGSRATSQLLEFFGAVELSFIVGGDFSIGDTDTLPTITRTFVAAVLDNAQEAALYDFFYHFSYKTAERNSEGLESGQGANFSGASSIEPIGVSVAGVGLESGSPTEMPEFLKALTSDLEIASSPF